MNTEQRLARLERELRIYRSTWVVVAAFVAVAILLGASKEPIPDVLRTHKLELLDEKGHARITAFAGSAYSTIRFTGDNGDTIDLSQTLGIPSIEVKSKVLSTMITPETISLRTHQPGKFQLGERSFVGDARVDLATIRPHIDGQGIGGGIQFFHWKQKDTPISQEQIDLIPTRHARGAVGVAGNGASILLLSDVNDEPAVVLGGLSTGGGTVEVHRAGVRQVHLSTVDSGGALSVINKTGEEVVTISADEYGNGVVGAWNRKGRGRTLQPGPSN